MKYPKLLRINQPLIRVLARAPIFLGLDYDGTLTPIIRDPKKAVIPAKTKKIIEKLRDSGACKIAVVSGRSIRQLNSLTGLKKITLVGNHGYEINEPGKRAWIHPEVRRARKTVSKIRPHIKKIVGQFPGAKLEDKALILAIHYRSLSGKRVGPLKAKIQEKIRKLKLARGLQWGYGKKVWELRPRIHWHKGAALRRMLKKGKTSYGSIFYFGDDITDEFAFRSLGGKAVTVKVGMNKKSLARYAVPTYKQVQKFLHQLSFILNDRERNKVEL